MILDNERTAKEAIERNERYNIEMQQKKEKAEYKELEAQIITGMRTTETKVGDDVKYHGKDAKVIGKYFEILYKNVNG